MEFTSTLFTSFLKSNGISHQLSCPHTPEQNGCVERKHRHLVETARTLLVVSHVPNLYWVEAFSTATYLINRLPISGLTTSPWKHIFKTFPFYSKLKIFGCSCFPWFKPYVSSKLKGKNKCCTFPFHTSITATISAASSSPHHLNAFPFDLHFSIQQSHPFTQRVPSITSSSTMPVTVPITNPPTVPLIDPLTMLPFNHLTVPITNHHLVPVAPTNVVNTHHTVT